MSSKACANVIGMEDEAALRVHSVYIASIQMLGSIRVVDNKEGSVDT